MNVTRNRSAKKKELKTGQIIWIEKEKLSKHLDKVVRGTVEETLNQLLDAEADRLCQAGRYERTDARRDTRSGHYTRELNTKAGEVRLKVPKLRTLLVLRSFIFFWFTLSLLNRSTRIDL